MRPASRSITLFVAAILAIGPLTSEGYNLKQISKRDGLSNSAILSIAQDGEGYMWLGTVDGVNLYDGTNMDNRGLFGPGNALSGSVIDRIHRSAGGAIWFMTNYGLDRYDPRTMTMSNFNGYTRKYLLRECPLAELFFITEKLQVVSYCDGRMVGQPFDYPFPAENILDYAEGPDGKIWIFGRDGSCCTYVAGPGQGGGMTLQESDRFVLHDAPLRFCSYDEGALYYMDSSYVVYEYDCAGRKKIYVTDLSATARNRSDISSMVKLNGDYYIGFYTDGLISLRERPEQVSRYAVETIGINAGVFTLLKDKRQQTLWVGTDGQGVYVYYDDSFSIRSYTFDSFTKRISKPVRSILTDPDGALWLATKGDGIVRIRDFNAERGIDQAKVDYFNTANSGLSNNSVFKLERSARGIMWIGNDEGIDYYSPATGRIAKLREPSGRDGLRYVHGIHQADEQTLWVATVGDGIYKVSLRWSGGVPEIAHKQRLVHTGGMEANYFFALYPQNDSLVWFGNRGYGAFRIDIRKTPSSGACLDEQANAGQVVSVKFDDYPGTRILNDIYCMARGSDSQMWFGTGAGLVRYSEDGTREVFDNRSGLPNSCIHGILNDASGNLWLSTNNGLVKFAPGDRTLLSINRSHGLDIIEFSDGAYYADPRAGTIFFGGINGFVSVTGTGYDRSAFIPGIIPSRLTVFGQERNLNDYLHDQGAVRRLVLDHSENYFSLSFSAIDYLHGHNYTFLYKIDGHSDNWVDNGNSGTLSFANLTPGDYDLQVMYRNRELGIESGVVTIPVRITPPWHLSATARTIYAVLLLVALLLGIYLLSKRADKRHRAVLDKLEDEHQKEVYEAKLRFFTNIAHEFCTPLTLIFGPCERILRHEKADPLIREYASVIHRNTNRLNDLIQDLIEFRRIETGNKAPAVRQVDISQAVSDIAQNFRVMAESKNVAYRTDIDPGLVWNTDPGFLTTIVTNLLSNAFKYVNAGGEVTVSARIGDGKLSVGVSNTGKGIKDEDIERIFDRYTVIRDLEESSVDKATIRNGLGLAISYNMAELLGGRIKVKSVRHKSTDFLLTLPPCELSPDEAAQEVPAPLLRPEQPVAGVSAMPSNLIQDKTKPTILVIDDETDMLWFMCDIFSAEYNVITTADPTGLEGILQETVPDVIISDVMMPGRDGLEIVRLVKSNPETAHVPLILVSANQQMAQQIEGLEVGAEMYITKPFNADYLRTFVRHLITRKQHLRDYFSSPISAYEFAKGRFTHKEHRRFIQQVIEIINGNLTSKDLSAKFIADRMNMGVRQLYRKLQSMEAESPLEMIHECRLHVAEDLLKNSTFTTDEIIYKSGFANRGPFFKAFAARFGCTPKEYRERIAPGREGRP